MPRTSHFSYPFIVIGGLEFFFYPGKGFIGVFLRRLVSHVTGYPARSRDKSCDRHTVTATRSPPHGHRHTATATRLPPHGHRHTATATRSPPYGHRHTVTATRLPPHGHRHAA